MKKTYITTQTIIAFSLLESPIMGWALNGSPSMGGPFAPSRNLPLNKLYI